MDGFQSAMAIGAVVSLCATVVALFVRRGDTPTEDTAAA
jgi:hypothetical protein